MRCGESTTVTFLSLADYLSKFAAGAKPGDLPVAQPTQFEFVVNMKTARALGIAIFRSVLVSVDQLVE